MRRSLLLLAALVFVLGGLVAVDQVASQYTMTPSIPYTHGDVTAIIPNNATSNIVGARWIQVTAAGNVTFKRSDGTNSPAIPIAANQSYGLARSFVNINATGTTATGILAFWADGVTPVTQVAP